jgi:hypothetical protein
LCSLACVINIRYHDNMIRTQISVDDELYRRAKVVARRNGISLAELCRRSLQAVVAKEPSDKPWMAFAGIVEGTLSDSDSVDDVVYGREAP